MCLLQVKDAESWWQCSWAEVEGSLAWPGAQNSASPSLLLPYGCWNRRMEKVKGRLEEVKAAQPCSTHGWWVWVMGCRGARAWSSKLLWEWEGATPICVHFPFLPYSAMPAESFHAAVPSSSFPFVQEGAMQINLWMGENCVVAKARWEMQPALGSAYTKGMPNTMNVPAPASTACKGCRRLRGTEWSSWMKLWGGEECGRRWLVEQAVHTGRG